MLPVIKPVSGDMFTFQQESALAHRARKTIGLLQHETSDFILPHLWPPNSPDLNPVDHTMWRVIEQHVYQSRVNTVDELKEHLIAVWSDFQQDIIDTSTDQVCVRANGGHFEHTVLANSSKQLAMLCVLIQVASAHGERFYCIDA